MAMLSDAHRKVLRKGTVKLLNDLDINNLIDHLVGAEILTGADEDCLERKPIRRDKIWELLHIIPRKGENGYIRFMEALRETQIHVYNYLHSLDTSSTNMQLPGISVAQYHCSSSEAIVVQATTQPSYPSMAMSASVSPNQQHYGTPSFMSPATHSSAQPTSEESVSPEQQHCGARPFTSPAADSSVQPSGQQYIQPLISDLSNLSVQPTDDTDNAAAAVPELTGPDTGQTIWPGRTKPRFPDSLVTEAALNTLAKRIGPDWKQLAIDMEFSTCQIHQFEQNHPEDDYYQRFCMLDGWRKKNGKDATISNLIQVILSHIPPISPTLYRYLYFESG